MSTKDAPHFELTKVELSTLNGNGWVSFDIWGKLDEHKFVGSYSYEINGQGSFTWEVDSGPDPGDNSDVFCLLQAGLYRSNAFKDAQECFKDRKPS